MGKYIKLNEYVIVVYWMKCYGNAKLQQRNFVIFQTFYA